MSSDRRHPPTPRAPAFRPLSPGFPRPGLSLCSATRWRRDRTCVSRPPCPCPPHAVPPPWTIEEHNDAASSSATRTVRRSVIFRFFISGTKKAILLEVFIHKSRSGAKLPTRLKRQLMAEPEVEAAWRAEFKRLGRATPERDFGKVAS